MGYLRTRGPVACVIIYFRCARIILSGIETMHLISKGQIKYSPRVNSRICAGAQAEMSRRESNVL